MNNPDDLKFMNRAFELALKGSGKVSPNPMVGCVIVHDDRIIGEGWHDQYGGAHAEVNAINSIVDRSLLKESTLYVTLEPCSHHGKTPPCADLIIKNQIKKVVISNHDPFDLVDGGGIQKLRQAGIEVIVGIGKNKGADINQRFFTYHQQKRPYIILKWAQTSDYFVAKENFDSKWISNEYARQLVHKWRAGEDSILVGTNTANYDNPSLTVRDWQGKHPLRLVIDKHLRLNERLNVFNQSTETVVYNLIRDERKESLTFKKIEEDNFLHNILADLYDRKILSLFVEGGAALLSSFIEIGIWDEARIFTSNTKFTNGISAPKVANKPISTTDIRGNQLKIYKR